MSKWTEEIDEITEGFLNSFGMLSEKDLNWKPPPEEWSIAENIDHLITLNETYFPAFKDLKSGNYSLPFIARFGFVVNFFGSFILKSVQPSNTKKTKTFPIWEPKKSTIGKDILPRFKAHQNRLKEEIQNIEEKVHENAVISSPANKNIVYKLGTAFDILIAHEKRHYAQAKKVLDLLGSTKQ